VELRIPDPALARLCCSRAELEARWGPAGALVGRHLCELSASVDLGAVARLPGVRVLTDTDGNHEVVFSEGITVRLRGDDLAPRDEGVVPAYRVAVAELTAVTVRLTEDVRL
jgi:hypothetical protein